jgi:hypothetical protein
MIVARTFSTTADTALVNNAANIAVATTDHPIFVGTSLDGEIAC